MPKNPKRSMWSFRITVEHGEYADRFEQICKNATWYGYVPEGGDDEEPRPHYHGVVVFPREYTYETMRARILKAFPECHGNQTWSTAAYDGEILFLAYMSKVNEVQWHGDCHLELPSHDDLKLLWKQHVKKKETKYAKDPSRITQFNMMKYVVECCKKNYSLSQEQEGQTLLDMKFPDSDEELLDFMIAQLKALCLKNKTIFPKPQDMARIAETAMYDLKYKQKTHHYDEQVKRAFFGV